MLNRHLQRRARLRSAIVAFTLVAALSVFFWRGAHHGRLHAQPLASKIKYEPSSYDWSQARIFYPLEDMKSPPTGKPKRFPPVQAKSKAKGGQQASDVVAFRKKAIKDAFIKSWEAYKKYAWGTDELMPLTATGKTTLSGWSAQLVDALDTLWIMGLKEDFRQATEQVAVIDWSRVRGKEPINLFEVTIRYLGGLLAAYDLSGEPVLRAKAVELGDTLYMAFDTPNRLPTHWLELAKAKAGHTIAEGKISSAAAGTLCLEFTRLTQITGDPKYYDATERVKLFFHRFQNTTLIPGMWSLDVNLRDEEMRAGMGAKYTISGSADSLYEYLPKMHALLGGLDAQYEAMATTALETIRDNVLFRPMTPRDDDILLAGTVVFWGGDRVFSTEMTHLTCFAGGMYALAGRLLGRDDFVDLGSRLTAGCVWEYDAMPTNIMPEAADFIACEKLDGPCPVNETLTKWQWSEETPGFVNIIQPAYHQRPEAIESVFYMWRITGDEAWRDAAWRMWEGIVRETETEIAFAEIYDVTMPSGGQADNMQTFWLSETLKYFYLIFEDESVLDLDEWVLNTEGHPFKRPK